MNFEKEIEWLRANGITGNRFKSEDHDDFTIGWLARLLNRHAEETVKNLNIPAVIKCDGDESEALLFAFVSYFNENTKQGVKIPEEMVDYFTEWKSKQ